jgi:hypothetical protein
MTMQAIGCHGQTVAAATIRGLFLCDRLARRPIGDPERTFVIYMGVYAADVLRGELPGPYADHDARRFAQAALVPEELADPDRLAHVGRNPGAHRPGAAAARRRARRRARSHRRRRRPGGAVAAAVGCRGLGGPPSRRAARRLWGVGDGRRAQSTLQRDGARPGRAGPRARPAPAARRAATACARASAAAPPRRGPRPHVGLAIEQREADHQRELEVRSRGELGDKRPDSHEASCRSRNR